MIEIPIYGRSLNIIVIDDIHEGLRSIDFHDFDEDQGLHATVVTDEDGLINLIIKPDANMNTICHEAFHITCNVLHDAGMKLCNKSEEGFSYFIGWVGEQIEDEMKREQGLKRLIAKGLQ